jgi:RNA polymerase sigma-70 factor (ECF subfamily)
MAYTVNNDTTVDSEILARIRAGDKAACALCIDHYGPMVYRVALRLMQNEADAEDVMQETFLNAFKSIDDFQGRSGLGTWLYRITYNNAMMRLRKPSASAFIVNTAQFDGDDGYAVPQQFFDWCCLPEKDFQKAEVRDELERAIGQLRPILRGVFTLRELEGLSTRETAAALEISEDLVKTRLHRARLQLREILSDYFSHRITVGEGNSDA